MRSRQRTLPLSTAFDSSKRWLCTGGMIPNPDTLWLNHPETCVDALRDQRTNGPVQAFETRTDRLIHGAQDDDARGAGRVIASDVGEVRIERNQDALLALADCLYGCVVSPDELFLVHVVDVPPLLLEPCLGGTGQILVQLELQRLRRNRHDPFVGESGGVGDRRRNVLRHQRGVLRQDGLGCLASGEIVQDDVHRHARPAHARGAVHPLRIDPDMGSPVHGFSEATDQNLMNVSSCA